MKHEFKVGDKARIRYISDCNPHNDEVGTITWLHSYCFYPNGDCNTVETRTQGRITYDDGTTESIEDFYRAGTGLVSPVEKVEN